MSSDTPGARLFLIRLACGDGVRKAESMQDFSDRVKKKTGRYYDPATLSLLERMKQGWKLEDALTFASVDPLKRGAVWLSALHELSQAPETKEAPATERPKYVVHKGPRPSEQETETRRKGRAG